jgi:hypothetical protein
MYMSAPDLSDAEAALADLDVLGDSATLRAQADAALSAAGDLRYAADGNVQLEQPGTLSVTVDPRGRLVDFRLDRNWGNRLGADELAKTLLSMYRTAMQQAFLVGRSADHPAEPATDPAQAAADQAPWASPAEEIHDEQRYDDWLPRAYAALADAEAALDAARKATANRPTQEQVQEVPSPKRLFTMHLRNGAPVDITAASARSLTLANADGIRRDVLGLFHAAGLADESAYVPEYR